MTDPRNVRGGPARSFRKWVESAVFARGESRSDADPDAAAATRAWLERIRPAAPQHIGGVEVVPLLLEPHWGHADLLAADAIASGALEIREVGDGVVQKVEARNGGRVDVLVLEGDTLVGCKQNRIVVRSLIIAPGATVMVAVGCMERGRWRHDGSKFGSGALRAEPWLRTSTMKEVSRGEPGRAPAFDQGRLWKQVDERLRSEGVRSHTDDYHAYLGSRRAETRRTLEQYVPVPDQVGMLCLAQGRLLGLEVTSHPDTFEALWRRTLPSYVLAAPFRGASGSVGREATAWLDALRRAEIRPCPGMGVGMDLELTGPEFLGRGLWHERRLPYLALFPN